MGDCFKYLRSQVVSDGGCERTHLIHRINEGYNEYGPLKGVLSNR